MRSRKGSGISKSFMTLSLFTTLLIGVGGCSSNNGGKHPPAEVQPLTNSTLKTKIEAKLNSDEALRMADLKIDTDARETKATLSGTVPTEALRHRAIELAQSAQDGLTLDSNLEVKPPNVARSEWNEEYSRAAFERAREAGDTVSNSLDDTWIHEKIVAKFVTDGSAARHSINVDVEKNVVTLRGTVDTQAPKEEAVRIAKDTDGVVRVFNKLRIGSS